MKIPILWRVYYAWNLACIQHISMELQHSPTMLTGNPHAWEDLCEIVAFMRTYQKQPRQFGFPSLCAMFEAAQGGVTKNVEFVRQQVEKKKRRLRKLRREMSQPTLAFYTTELIDDVFRLDDEVDVMKDDLKFLTLKQKYLDKFVKQLKAHLN